MGLSPAGALAVSAALKGLVCALPGRKRPFSIIIIINQSHAILNIAVCSRYGISRNDVLKLALKRSLSFRHSLLVHMSCHINTSCTLEIECCMLLWQHQVINRSLDRLIAILDLTIARFIGRWITRYCYRALLYSSTHSLRQSRA